MFSFTEEEEAEYELGIDDALDDEEADARSDTGDEGTGGRAHHKPGPMPKADVEEFNEKCRQFRAYLNSRARKSRKDPAVLWRMAGLFFNFLRQRTIYNLFVKKFCLLNPKGADGA